MIRYETKFRTACRRNPLAAGTLLLCAVVGVFAAWSGRVPDIDTQISLLLTAEAGLLGSAILLAQDAPKGK
jgi:hypothetical protein